MAKEDTRFHLVKPTPKLIENNITPFGLVNVQTDSDGFIRKYPVFLQDPQDNSNIHYTAAIEAVLAFNGKSIKDISGASESEIIMPSIKMYNDIILTTLFIIYSYFHNVRIFRTIKFY